MYPNKNVFTFSFLTGVLRAWLTFEKYYIPF